MFIDIHCHCHIRRHAGIVRQINNLTYPDPEELTAMMDKAGIDKAVLLCAVSPEMKWTIVTPEEVYGICQMYPDRFIPFCNFDPRFLTNSTDANFRPLLSVYKEMGFKGIGEYMANLPFDDPLNMNFFGQVEESGFPLTFHIAPTIGGDYGCYDDPGLPRLEKVLKTFPGLTLLGHSAAFWIEISRNVDVDNRNGYAKGPVTPGRVIELMREYPNLHGDLSAGSGLNALSRDREFGYRFLEEFQDRLYFGTDICNVGQDVTPMMQYYHDLREYNRISTEAYEKITWKNTARLLSLDIAATQ